YTLFEENNYEKQCKQEAVVDQIRERFGEDAIMRACFLEPDQIAPMGGGLSKARRSGVTKPV
ncbi:MAG: DNA polymerase IV, partial [Clostridiales bacterium]